MSKAYRLGTVAGLRIAAERSAFYTSAAFWILVSGGGILLLDLSPTEAIVGGLAAVGLHWLAGFAHHLGHAWAARRTGFPMSGLYCRLLLCASRYPRDEPQLPANVHIRRALGGPLFSLLLAAAAGFLGVLLQAQGGRLWYLAAFLALDSLLVFTVGALLPLGFTDGSTLLEWWPRRER